MTAASPDPAAWDRRNLALWEKTLRGLFGGTPPATETWTDKREIVRILSTLGRKDGLGWVFVPWGGGFPLSGASESCESGCIELGLIGIAHVVSPGGLTFESFGSDYQWAYFRLEAASLAPTGEDEEPSEYEEQLTELRPGYYVSGSVWHGGSYREDGNEKPLPARARPVGRCLRGCFVVFARASVYNQVSETYDARHERMTADEFRQYIERVSQSADPFAALSRRPSA